MSEKVRNAGNCFIVGMSAGAVLASGRGLRVAMCTAIVLGVVNLLLYLWARKDRHE